MRYQRFEELPVWNDAIELAVQVFALTSQPEFRSKRRLREQIEAAAVSVSNNIAEGFERGTNNELLTFLYIARGSAGEVRSMLILLERIPLFQAHTSRVKSLKQLAESCSKQLRAWAQSLQNSGLRGERYVNDKTRLESQRVREREEFLEELSTTMARNRAANN
jgi:four helix bundle protein